MKPTRHSQGSWHMILSPWYWLSREKRWGSESQGVEREASECSNEKYEDSSSVALSSEI